MKKNSKIIIVLVIAVVMALLASTAVISYLTPHRATTYIFKDSYDIGTPLTSDMLVPIQVDSNIVVGGTKKNINDQFVTSADIRTILQSGDSLKVSVGAGMPLMRSLLSISGGNSIMMSMAPSSVAVTVSVDSTTGITKDLYSGAYVNVYVTSYSGGTFLLFEDMRILEISRKSNGDLQSATFEVTNEQAVKLINSTKNGSIHLGLINPNGYVYEPGTSEILVNPEAQTDQTTTKETSESAKENNQSGSESKNSGTEGDTDIIAPSIEE